MFVTGTNKRPVSCRHTHTHRLLLSISVTQTSVFFLFCLLLLSFPRSDAAHQNILFVSMRVRVCAQHACRSLPGIWHITVRGICSFWAWTLLRLAYLLSFLCCHFHDTPHIFDHPTKKWPDVRTADRKKKNKVRDRNAFEVKWWKRGEEQLWQLLFFFFFNEKNCCSLRRQERHRETLRERERR